MNIFVINKETKQNLGILDFVSRKEEHIVLKGNDFKNIECIVECVLYEPNQHAILIFVSIVKPYYSKMISEIKWN